jgi:RNA polymerase sigma-70 factor (ECF subfamily)
MVSDEELVVAIARGDRCAFAALYERHIASLGALSRRMLRHERDAQDVLHDVFVETWARARDFDPTRGSARAWLALRLRSRCLDRIRCASERRTALCAEMDDEPASGRLIATVEERRLRDALHALPDEQRAVLDLGYYEGLSTREIAERLQIPLGTVKSRTAAAMDRLRRRLGN